MKGLALCANSPRNPPLADTRNLSFFQARHLRPAYLPARLALVAEFFDQASDLDFQLSIL